MEFAIMALASAVIFYILNPKYRIAYLSVLSCVFIASFNYTLLLYIVAYSVFNYFIGLKIPDSKNKILLFRFGIIVNISQLVLLKYASFAIDPVFQLFNSSVQVSKLSEIIIPVGISYFTLQGIGYLVNVKMGWEKPENKFLDFFLYLVFFPKFLAGPIERSNHFLPQLKSPLVFNENQVSAGLRIALFGFFKKVVIADNLANLVMAAHSDVSAFSGPELWFVLLLQPLYLYFDFSGYTDIAIGIAKTYGIDLLPNFNRPFLAENMTNFWKRFHISLSAWFNDYVFKQTNFRYRKWGNYAAVYAVILTWVLFGIWHGAGWNFMALGLLQAIAILYEFFTKRKRLKIGSKVPLFWRSFLSRIVTYVFYGFSLVFFFSPSFGSSLQFYSKLTDLSSGSFTGQVYHMLVFVLGLAFVFLLLDYLKEDFAEKNKWIQKIFTNNSFVRIVMYYSMVIMVLIFIGKKITFIYQVF